MTSSVAPLASLRLAESTLPIYIPSIPSSESLKRRHPSGTATSGRARNGRRRRGRSGSLIRSFQDGSDNSAPGLIINNEGDDTGKSVGIRGGSSAPTCYACPFFKFDPVRHFRCYCKYELRRYIDVKQHIIRRHTLGTLYCSNCWATFDDRWDSVQAWVAHCQQHACENKPVPDRLLPSEAAALQELAHGHVEEEAKWYQMWDLLFPRHPRPDSPHMVTEASDILSQLGPPVSKLLEKLPGLLSSRGIDIDFEATASLAEEIHHIYTNIPLKATTRL